MVYKQEIKIDKKTFAMIADKAINGPQEVFSQYGNLIAAIGNEAVALLSQEPGKPRYPLRWTSERQRRFVMAKLTRSGNLPYNRTGKYAQAWDWQATSTADGGVFSVFNTAKTDKGLLLEQFVQGDRQQGFHADTGWVSSERIKKEAGIKAELGIITLWEDVMGTL